MKEEEAEVGMTPPIEIGTLTDLKRAYPSLGRRRLGAVIILQDLSRRKRLPTGRQSSIIGLRFRHVN